VTHRSAQISRWRKQINPRPPHPMECVFEPDIDRGGPAMHATNRFGFTATAIAFCLTLVGCNNAPPPQDKADYSQTLNRYYQGRPVCIWSDTVSFPVQAATPDQIKEDGLNALVDAGLLVRWRAPKGAPAGSYSYDLSPEGRSALDANLDDKAPFRAPSRR
jgi:hypothetical protein